ncbi:MAG: 1-acyl-sn-glycerol-3-phosphate acyltransferase [Desulfovibrionales bacterium]
MTEGGENVQPDEVEDFLSEHPLIREAGVLERNGRLAAVIVPDPGEIRRTGQEDIGASVRKAVQEQSNRMPSYQRIADFAVTRESLPRTRLGKVRRHLLEERFEQAKKEEKQPGTEEKGPLPLERMSDQDQSLLENDTVREVWNWLVGRYPEQRLTPDTSPQLDLGVDSMEWLNITLNIRQRTGVEITEEAIGRIETIRDLLQEAAEQSEAKGVTTEGLPLENPEQALSGYQMRWLGPQGRTASLLAHGLIRMNRVLMQTFFQIEVVGKENIPENEQVLFTPNHVSYLDPFLLAAVLDTRKLRNSFWAGWTGAAFHNPVNRAVSRLAHTIPIDPEKGVFSSLAFAAAVVKRGKNLIWFPEGGRTFSGRLEPFKPGIGLILDHFPIRTVPIFISGTEKSMPRGTALPRPAKVRVVFGKPVYPQELKDDGQGEDSRERIVSGLYKRIAEMARAEGKPPKDE